MPHELRVQRLDARHAGRAQVHGALGQTASLIACHTRWGVAGMSTCLTPRCETAWMTAFQTAGVEPIVPASPMPLAPSGLRGVGVCVRSVSYIGRSPALGIA